MMTIEEVESDIYDKIMFCHTHMHSSSTPYFLLLYVLEIDRKCNSKSFDISGVITNSIVLILNLFFNCDTDRDEGRISSQERSYLTNTFKSLILV